MEQKIIYSEQLHISVTPSEIVTVLGSCVAVCLFDTKNKISGMNHYLLPLWNGNGLKSLKYGNISIERLIEAMQAVGADHRSIEAKIFGGAMLNINEEISVAPRNISIAVDMLRHYRIPIVAQDVCGNRGRKVIFSNDDGSAYVKYSK
ncbi:MAG: chemotaxis protein CheD [Sulfurimonas sp.]